MTRALVVVGLVVLGTLEVPPESQHPQTQDRLGGHVYTQDSKAPVRSAIVYVISVDTGRAVTVMTSIDGSWGVAGLAPGRYRVNVRAPGYVPGTFGQTTAWGTGRTLAVPKDDVAPADVFLFKGGVISGRVVDQAGNPVVGIGVSVMRRNRSALGTTVEPIMETVKTDDLGV